MMDNDEDFFEFEEEDNEFGELLSKFESFVQKGEHHFFDSQDILELADYYIGWMDKDMANKAIEIGLQYYPNNPYILLKQAEVLAKQNRTSDALRILNSIEPQLNTEPRYYLVRGDVFSQMNLTEQAVREYKKLLDINYPNKDFVYDVIGSEYMMKNKFEEALYYFKKAIEFDIENCHVALYKIYFCYSELHKQQEGIEYFQKIIDQTPFNADAWLYISYCYMELYRYEDALESINYAQVINPSDLLIILKKSDILKALNRYNEAIDLLKETLDKEPKNAYMMNVLAETYNEVADYEKASYYFHKALHINPKDSRAWLGLAEAYAYMSQDNESVSCIQHALTNAKNDPEALLKAGKLYLLLELYEEALNILKYNFEKGYDTPELIMWLSIALEKSGYVSDAVNLLSDQIYHQHKTDAELLYCLAGILLLYQYRQDGLQTLEKALQTNPLKHPILYEFSRFFEDDMEIQTLIQQYTTD